MDFTLTNIFFLIVSAALVVIAGAISIGIYFFLGVIKDVQDLVRSLNAEVDSFRSTRKEIELNGRTMLKMVKVLALRFLFRGR